MILIVEDAGWCKAFLSVGPFAVTWSELLISLQTAVILFPINLVIGQLFPLIQPQEPLPPFPPIQASCLSDASLEPLSLAKVVEVSLVSNFTGKWHAPLPHLVGKTNGRDLLEGSWGPVNLDSFSLILVPWVAIHHTSSFFSWFWSILRAECEYRTYFSGVVLVLAVWSNSPFFFHSIFSHKTSFEATVRWLLSEKVERKRKIKVLYTKHMPLWVKEQPCYHL